MYKSVIIPRRAMVLLMTLPLLTISMAQVSPYWNLTGTNIYNNNPGLVGIGTSTPSANLHVNANNVKFTNGSSGFEFFPGSCGVEITNSSNIFGYFDFKGNAYTGQDYRGRIIHYDNSGFQFITNSPSNKYMVFDNNGRLGVGTYTPLVTLHVVGGQAIFDETNSSVQISPSQGAILLKSNNNNSFIDFKTSTVGANPFQGRILYNNTTGFAIYTNANTTPKMVLDNNGKVTIGDPALINTSTTGTYKLYVQDGILTERVKVAIRNTTDWSDYVFDPGYVLQPLNEVKSYVWENCHLPDVPSAEEVVNNGVDLAKMDAMLLRKIEELTLYTIQLSEENASLRRDIKSLRQEIKSGLNNENKQ